MLISVSTKAIHTSPLSCRALPLPCALTVQKTRSVQVSLFFSPAHVAHWISQFDSQVAILFFRSPFSFIAKQQTMQTSTICSLGRFYLFFGLLSHILISHFLSSPSFLLSSPSAFFSFSFPPDSTLTSRLLPSFSHDKQRQQHQ